MYNGRPNWLCTGMSDRTGNLEGSGDRFRLAHVFILISGCVFAFGLQQNWAYLSNSDVSGRTLRDALRVYFSGLNQGLSVAGLICLALHRQRFRSAGHWLLLYTGGLWLRQSFVDTIYFFNFEYWNASTVAYIDFDSLVWISFWGSVVLAIIILVASFWTLKRRMYLWCFCFSAVLIRDVIAIAGGSIIGWHMNIASLYNWHISVSTFLALAILATAVVDFGVGSKSTHGMGYANRDWLHSFGIVMFVVDLVATIEAYHSML